MAIQRVELEDGTKGTIDTTDPQRRFIPDASGRGKVAEFLRSGIGKALITARDIPSTINPLGLPIAEALKRLPASTIQTFSDEVLSPAAFEFADVAGFGLPREVLRRTGIPAPEPQTGLGKATKFGAGVAGFITGGPQQIAGRIGRKAIAPLAGRLAGRFPKAAKLGLEPLVKASGEAAASVGSTGFGPALGADSVGKGLKEIGGRAALGAVLPFVPALIGPTATIAGLGGLAISSPGLVKTAATIAIARPIIKKFIGPQLKRATRIGSIAEKIRTTVPKIKAHVRKDFIQSVRNVTIAFKAIEKEFKSRLKVASNTIEKDLEVFTGSKGRSAGTLSEATFQSAIEIQAAAPRYLAEFSRAWGDKAIFLFKGAKGQFNGRTLADTAQQVVSEHVGFMGNPQNITPIQQMITQVSEQFRGSQFVSPQALSQAIKQFRQLLPKGSSRSAFTPDQKLISDVVAAWANRLKSKVPGLKTHLQSWAVHAKDRNRMIRSLGLFGDDFTSGVQKFLAEHGPSARGVGGNPFSESQVKFLRELEPKLGRDLLGEITFIQKEIMNRQAGIVAIRSDLPTGILQRRLRQLAGQLEKKKQALSEAEKSRMFEVDAVLDKWLKQEGVGIFGTILKLPARFLAKPATEIPILGAILKQFNVGLLTVGSMLKAFDAIVNVSLPIRQKLIAAATPKIAQASKLAQTAAGKAGRKVRTTFELAQAGTAQVVRGGAKERVEVELDNGMRGTMVPGKPETFKLLAI